VTNGVTQRFARATNLVLQAEPYFDPFAFGRHGKIMDSWYVVVVVVVVFCDCVVCRESARHNPLPYDIAVFRLAQPADITYKISPALSLSLSLSLSR
jgi:allantoicase